MVCVSIAREASRYETVSKALKLISDDIEKTINGKRKILIKPNFVSVYRQLAATHVDAVKAVLDFIQQFSPKEVIIAKGSAENTFVGFRNYGYINLKKDYDVELIDLNEDEYIEFPIFDEKLDEMNIRIARTVVESDYRISTALLKTHDTVIVTLSLKNMVMGSVVGDDKPKVHQGYKAINLSLYKMAKFIPTHLAVTDGWRGMEGNGPVAGSSVDMKIALAGIDAIAVDSVAAYLMGFDPEEIGYLYYARNLGSSNSTKIDVVGLKPEEVRKKFKPHLSYEMQKNWKIPNSILQKLLDEINNL
jgi:uncharacterized protein (DUF362 family)